ncbi:unnamed protein product [Caenorhabditis sp. 36 PRJEB53466]|nr:unnamed protein product [Caenorhabditis sp. 36 PRJEB53466]
MYSDKTRHEELGEDVPPSLDELRRSMHRFGPLKILAILNPRILAIYWDECSVRFLVRTFRSSLAHVKRLADRFLSSLGSVEPYVDVFDTVSSSHFGITITDYGSDVVVPIGEVLGHAVYTYVHNSLLVLPLASSPTCS